MYSKGVPKMRPPELVGEGAWWCAAESLESGACTGLVLVMLS